MLKVAFTQYSVLQIPVKDIKVEDCDEDVEVCNVSDDDSDLRRELCGEISLTTMVSIWALH